MIPLDQLPLSPELTARLRAWASTFDSLMGNDFAWSSPGARAEWVAEGHALLEPLRQELGPEYDVELFAGHA